MQKSEKKIAKYLQIKKNVVPLQPQTRNNGSLDEWLSQRSAKPCTAVRIRQEPPHHFKNKYAKGNNP